MRHRKLARIPTHLGVIPDGNRRWAEARGLPKEAGYAHGLDAGMALFDLVEELGIPELTLYGFTSDNTRRPAVQTAAFREACVQAVERIAARDAAVLVVGNDASPLFPEALRPYRKRRALGASGRAKMRVNLLVNYDWNWDVSCAQTSPKGSRRHLMESIGSADVSRLDLVVRWGGRTRLSGLLPLQAVYADIFTVDALWPDFESEDLFRALAWYQTQDPTLGG